MKAIVTSEAGTADVLELKEIPTPKIGKATEILVKLKAAGVNPIDTKLRSRGTFYPEQMPAVLGCDGAGIVEAIGTQVTKFKVGDEVYFCSGGLGKKNTGNYAEYAVIEESLVAKKPSSLSFAEAAAAPLVLITAWESLYDRTNLQSGQTVLIQGGAGGVGHVAVQLAKLKGAKVATTVGTTDKEKLVRQLGADFPILYKQKDVVKDILNWTNGEGVDVGFDTVGGKTFFDTCEAVKVYGDVVTILEPDSSIGNLKLARQRNQRISLELMLTPALMDLPIALIHQTKILEQCSQWFDQGKLKIHLNRTYPLEQASIAHQAIESGSTTGKIALII